jgi:hypothetical protein
MTRVLTNVSVGLLIASAGCGGNSASTSTLAAPTDLQVAALEGGAHLTWKDNSSDEASFMIERMAGSSDWSTIGSVPFNTTQYHDANLTPGTTYMYRVMAMPKSGGSGPYSNEVTFVAPADSMAAGSGAGAAGAAGSAHTGHTP